MRKCKIIRLLVSMDVSAVAATAEITTTTTSTTTITAAKSTYRANELSCRTSSDKLFKHLIQLECIQQTAEYERRKKNGHRSAMRRDAIVHK